MKFGERLQSSQHPPWSEYYINYHRLKCLLRPLFGLPMNEEGVSSPTATTTVVEEDNREAAGSSSSSPHRALVSLSSHSFEIELKYEIRKATFFILQMMGEISSHLATLLEQQQRHIMATNIQATVGQQNTNNLIEVEQQLNQISQLRNKYIQQIGIKVLLLLEFVELNIEAIIKIVKKHDKFLVRWEEEHTNNANNHPYKRLRRQYLPRFAIYSDDPNVRCLFVMAADAGAGNNSSSSGGRGGEGRVSTLEQLLSRRNSQNSSQSSLFGGWDVLQWNLENALKELHQWEMNLKNNNVKKVVDDNDMDGFKALSSSKSFSAIPSSQQRRKSSEDNSSSSSPMKRFLTKSSSILGLANVTQTNVTISKSNIKSSQQPNNSFFEPVLYQIQSSRKRLSQMHSRYIRMVYAHEMLHLIGDGGGVNMQHEDEKYMDHRIRKQSIGGNDDDDIINQQLLLDSSSAYHPPTVSTLSKLLNLTSAGLYMMNYNIVAPTSGLYAELLGFDPANAGIIIGMTPMAVILSSVLYSWWSSYSYKRA